MKTKKILLILIAISSIISLNAQKTGTFKDTRDGHTYKWVKIGNQIWMAENLNYYTSSGSWCYDNKAANCKIYGRLYNWETAMKVCPQGWHLPTDEEWKELEMYIGISRNEVNKYGNRGTDKGNRLKTSSGWKSGGNGTDLYGFSGLPSGNRNVNGTFDNIGYYGIWWVAESKKEYGAYRRLDYNENGVSSGGLVIQNGFSVRCIKDE